MRPKTVIIDGVKYAPVTESAPTMRQIAEGIVAMWWGRIDEEEGWLEEKMEYLRVEVNDSGNGDTIEALLASIQERLNS